VTVWDAANQQVVREDQSAPWDEGAGGPPGPTAEELAEQQLVAQEEQAEAEDLDALTKDELIAKAQAMGVSPAHQGMTKAELIEAMEGA
jgi:hypothetical protein